MDDKRSQAPDSTTGEVHLSCKECCKEIPYSPESEDYVTYFCGIECFQEWQEKMPPDEGDGGPDNVYIYGGSPGAKNNE